MAQFGGEQLKKQQAGNKTEEYAPNPLHSTPAAHDIGGTGPTKGMGAGHDCQERKPGVGEKIKEKLPGSGGDHKTSATCTDDGVGGGHAAGGKAGQPEKKGMMENIKDKLPGAKN